MNRAMAIAMALTATALLLAPILAARTLSWGVRFLASNLIILELN